MAEEKIVDVQAILDGIEMVNKKTGESDRSATLAGQQFKEALDKWTAVTRGATPAKVQKAAGLLQQAAAKVAEAKQAIAESQAKANEYAAEY